MLNPAEAFSRLCNGRPFDDPTMSWYPHRWYFNERGVMCYEPWRCVPTEHPDFVRPKIDRPPSA